MRTARAATPAAVVIGLDSVTGLQTARILAARDIPVVGIARNRRHPSCRTNVCERIEFTQTHGDALAIRLAELAPTFATAPVLFPCTDLSVLAISQHREMLAGPYRAVLPLPGVIELLLDKGRFQAHAVAAGLPIARTCVLRTRVDAEHAADTLRFPCVLKPAVKTVVWQAHTSAKVFRVTNPRELLDRYDMCGRWADALIAQEWVDGPDSAHVTCNAYFDANSHPRVAFVSQKLRQWPLEGGVGCLSQECRNDTVLGETSRLFQGVGHRGLAYLEMKFDVRDGRYVIIEPNVGRPTGRSAAADVAGVELLHTQYCDALARPLPPVREQSYGTAKWIYFRQDLQAALQQARRGRLTPAGWLRSLRGCHRDALFSWRDPAPFLADLITAFGKTVATPRAAEDETGRRSTTVGPVDFDVHGVVGLRLVDASAADIAAVIRQVGPPVGALHRDPDIVVRFVDDLSVDGLCWVEHGRTGYTDDGFFFLQSGKRPARVKIPLDEIGGRCEIVCQRGLHSIPLLMAIVNVTALERGCVALHASAFVHRGAGVLVTGWAKGGKTESLLAFAAEGAEYVGDEWILLSPDGRMLGIPEVMRVQDWHLDQLPHLRHTVSTTRKLFFKAIRALDAIYRGLPDGRVRRLFPSKVLGDALPALRRQLNAQVDPLRVFRSRRDGRADAPSTLFFMVSDDTATVRVDRADPADIARRMAASVSYEQLPLMSAYLAFRFAFPERRNALLESAAAIQSERLVRVLSGKDAFIVRHPYPCSLRELFEAMAPLCQSRSTVTAHGEAPEQRFATVTARAG